MLRYDHGPSARSPPKPSSITSASCAAPSKTSATTARTRASTTKTCNLLVAIEEQSPDIAQGLHYEEALEKLGAGDQGIMFGYATDETPEYLPLTILYAHALNRAMSDARRDGSLPWLRPDTKTQVTVEYEHDGGAVVPKRVDTVVVSCQHDETIQTPELRKEILEKIVKKTIPAKYLDDRTVLPRTPPSAPFVA